MMDESIIIVGQLGAPHGLKGWLKLTSYTQPRDNIFNYQPWLLQRQPGDWQPLTTTLQHQQHTQKLLVLLPDCHDCDQARHYTHTRIGIYRHQLPPSGDQQYYWTDLQGLQVFNQQGEHLGVVDYVLATGANDVLVVKGDTEHLIPFILDQYILKVDLSAQRIDVAWDADFLS
ncbi:MAG: ribosome maturation factor RimM [Legionellales bacterium]|nr:ribosome maturation factor RimM [Legionellales bacterium]